MAIAHPRSLPACLPAADDAPAPLCTVDADADGAGDKNDDGDDDDVMMVVVVEWNSPELPHDESGMYDAGTVR